MTRCTLSLMRHNLTIRASLARLNHTGVWARVQAQEMARNRDNLLPGAQQALPDIHQQEHTAAGHRTRSTGTQRHRDRFFRRHQRHR